MSRTNPYKKKKRQANKTLLIFGEGFDEEIFLKHLKSLYSYNIDTKITIRKGRGGDAQSVVIDADRVSGAFDRKIVILDNDKTKEEMTKARYEARNRGIELIENTPCLEFLLLSILHRKPSGKNSPWCKKEFESRYIDKKKRGESSEYIKFFPKPLLDSQKLKLSELRKLVLIMEGK